MTWTSAEPESIAQTWVVVAKPFAVFDCPGHDTTDHDVVAAARTFWQTRVDAFNDELQQRPGDPYWTASRDRAAAVVEQLNLGDYEIRRVTVGRPQ